MMKKRMLFILLVLVMVFSLFPALSAPAEAAYTNVKISTGPELKKYLTAPERYFIILTKDIDYHDDGDYLYWCSIAGTKEINLNGHSITIHNDDIYESTLFQIPAGATLAIHDKTGSNNDDVKIRYNGYLNEDGDLKYRHLCEVSGTFVLNGGMLEAGRSKRVYSARYVRYARKQTEGIAVFVKTGGTFVMNGGAAYGRGYFSAGVLVQSGGTAYINNGIVQGRGQADCFSNEGKLRVAAGHFETHGFDLHYEGGEAWWVTYKPYVKLSADEIAENAVYTGDLNQCTNLTVTPGNGSCTLGKYYSDSVERTDYLELKEGHAKVRTSFSDTENYFQGIDPDLMESPVLYQTSLDWQVMEGNQTVATLDASKKWSVDLENDFPGFTPQYGKVYTVKCVITERLGERLSATRSGSINVAIKQIHQNDIQLNAANFPDDTFRGYLADNFDLDKDGWLGPWEIERIYEIHIGGTDVASLQGIEYLNFVDYIYAYHTKITSFDGSVLPYLRILDLSECPVTSVNLAQNTNLRELYLDNCTARVTNLDLSNCPLLEKLETYNSDSRYNIWDVDISACPLLVDAALHNEKVAFPSNSPYAYQYKSAETGAYVSISYRHTQDLIVAHYDTAFPNERLRSVVQRDYDWGKDGLMELNEALNITAIDVGDDEDTVTDLTGIELLPNLDYLAAFHCEIMSIDVSQNPKLTWLDVANTPLRELDLSHNPALTRLYCNRTDLIKLDLSGCPEMRYVAADQCDYLDTVNVNGLTKLEYLDLSDCSLYDLDVSSNTALTNLQVYNNWLGELDVSQNTNLKVLSAQSNFLDDLILPESDALQKLRVYHNDIDTLDVSGCSTLCTQYNNGTKSTKMDGDLLYVRYTTESGSDPAKFLEVDTFTQVFTGGTPTYAITADPESTTVTGSEYATFTVQATGSDLSYQWQYKTPNGEWKDCSSATTGYNTATLKVQGVTGSTNRSGYAYRCVVTAASGWSDTSEAATLTVSEGVYITTQPSNATVKTGATATFKVAASGSNLTYQWQWRKSAPAEWTDCTSATQGYNTAALKVEGAAKRNGYQYRCVVTGTEGSAASDAAKLTVQAADVSITTQPSDATVKTGATATFKVAASGSNLTYQWQWRKSASAEWTDCTSTTAGYNTAAIKVEGAAKRNGYQYRCVVTGTEGSAASNAAKLTVTSALAITTQPKAASVKTTGTATFTVKATGSGLKYRWQYLKPGGSWTDCTSATKGYNTATLTVQGVTGGTNRDGYQYRCIVTDSAGGKVTSGAAKLSVLAITTQPKAATVSKTGTASFTVKATGSGLKYQWQFKTPSGDWKNCTSATQGYQAATLKVAGASGNVNRNGYQYRCIVTDAAGNTLTTSAVKLTVK